QPADEDARFAPRHWTGERHHRVLGTVHAARHQVIAVRADDVFAIVVAKFEPRAIRRRHRVEFVPGLHSFRMPALPPKDESWSGRGTGRIGPTVALCPAPLWLPCRRAGC